MQDKEKAPVLKIPGLFHIEYSLSHPNQTAIRLRKIDRIPKQLHRKHQTRTIGIYLRIQSL